MCNESVLEHDWKPHNSLLATGTRVVEAKGTEKKINEVGELYRPSAERASFPFFLFSDLFEIKPLQQSPLKVRPLALILSKNTIQIVLQTFGWCFLSYLKATLSSYVFLPQHLSVFPFNNHGADRIEWWCEHPPWDRHLFSIPVRQPGFVWERRVNLRGTHCLAGERLRAASKVGPPVSLINQTTFLPPH